MINLLEKDVTWLTRRLQPGVKNAIEDFNHPVFIAGGFIRATISVEMDLKDIAIALRQGINDLTTDGDIAALQSILTDLNTSISNLKSTANDVKQIVPDVPDVPPDAGAEPPPANGDSASAPPPQATEPLPAGEPEPSPAPADSNGDSKQ